MARRLVYICMLSAALTGCMNAYTRCPWTRPTIEDTYQCTGETAAMAYVVMFPQVMMASHNNKPLLPENLISVPVGCLCFVDVAAEAVVDTICWPFDVTRRDDKKETR